MPPNLDRSASSVPLRSAVRASRFEPAATTSAGATVWVAILRKTSVGNRAAPRRAVARAGASAPYLSFEAVFSQAAMREAPRREAGYACVCVNAGRPGTKHLLD